MSYQFVHLEIYSRKGRAGRGVNFVLAEADRLPDASLHVAAPAAPEIIFGVDIAEVRRLHDERAATAKVTLTNGKRRAVRNDQNTLVTVVASHPATTDASRENAALARQVRDWEVRTVEWLREQYGDQLASVVRHVDEAHPHLHAFVIPDDADMRAARLHPGQSAKGELLAAGPGAGEDAKAVHRRGDRAYRAAMREWQDSYWQHVGLPCGLTRLGPGRRRLTREEWKAERTQTEAVRTAQERVAALKADGQTFISATRARADAIWHEAQDEAARLHVDAVKRQKHAMHLQDVATARLAAAHKALHNAQREGRRILDLARARAERLRSFGSGLRSLWDGLRFSRIENDIRRSLADDIAAERRRADQAGREAMHERRKRRDTEQRQERIVAAVHAVGRERDAARRELAALRPEDPHHERSYGARQ